MSQSPSQRLAASPQQRRVARLLAEAPAHPLRVGAAFRVEGPLTADALRATLERLAAEVEVLRTRVEMGDEAAQVIEPAARLEVEERAVAGLDDAAVAEALHALVDRPRAAAEPAVRAVLLSDGSGRVLLLAQPAELADQRSLVVLAQAVATLQAGGEVAAPRDEDGEPLQYADLAAFQEEVLHGPEGAPARERLAALPLAADREERLGLERPAAEAPAEPPRALARPLSTAAAEALARLAGERGEARPAVLLAAWALLLSRHADRAEPLLALACEGRDYEGLDVALGAFEKHVPLVVTVDAMEPFAALARRAEEAIARALEDQDGFDPSGGEAPPFAFAWRAPARAAAGGLTLTAVHRTGLPDRARLALVADVADAAPVLRLAWDPAALDAEDVGALADQLETLLVEAAARPDAPLAELTGLDDATRARLLGELATTPAGERPETTLPRWIAEHAARTPDALAVTDGETDRTYAVLLSRARRLARYLRSLGVGPGRYVGLYLDRSTAMIEAILGVLEAGGAYLPLPPAYPDERVTFMLEDTGAPVVLTTTLRSGDLPASAARVVVLDQVEAEIAALDDGPLADGAGWADPAYVIYTSGSTGKPKGVPIAHGNLAHSTRAREEYYREPVGAYLLLSSFAFDSSVPGIFWTLASGGTLVLPEEGAERDLVALPARIREHGVTHLLSLPSVYGLLLDTAGPDAAEALASLRVVIVAGESAAPELVERHHALLPGCALFDEYGPTENTVWSSVQRCTPGSVRATVPIGRPVPGVHLRVVAPDGATLEPCAPGLPGELLVGGPQLTAGYLGRPELTAERFVADPLVPGARLYRTGDLVRMLPDGTLEFLGRLDHQVKLRGYRIELEEIEAVLARHAAVREAVVVACEVGPGDRRLVAHVVPAGADAPAVPALREHVAQTLPEYMVPALVSLRSELPRLPNGKVDRRALSTPEAVAAASTGRAAATARADTYAGTPLERLIGHLWADLLELDAVGPDDDFFELGGHSLLAARLFAQLTEMLQVQAPLRLLFDAPTVRGLAAGIAALPEDGPRAARAAELTLEVLGLDGAEAAEEGSPESALEKLVAGMWADALGVEEVGPEDDFFELGGHSLLAARLFAHLAETLQVQAPLRILFENPTVRGVCAVLRSDAATAERLERTAELALSVLGQE